MSRLEPHRHKLIAHRPSRKESCKQATTPRAKGEEEQEQTQKLLESLSPGEGLFEGTCLIRSGPPRIVFFINFKSTD